MSLESRLTRLLADRPAAAVDAIATSRLVMRAATLLEARIDAALAPHGLVMREYLALVLIADDAVEPLRPSDLSVTLDATRTQITRLLDALERKGLVERLPGRTDRRSLQLAQTPAGAQLTSTVSPLVHAAYVNAWAPLGEQETHAVRGALDKLHTHLETPADARSEPDAADEVKA